MSCNSFIKYLKTKVENRSSDLQRYTSMNRFRVKKSKGPNHLYAQEPELTNFYFRY